MVFVQARDVCVDYNIYSARGRSIKNELFRTVGGRIKVGDDSRVVVNALWSQAQAKSASPGAYLRFLT